MIDLPTHYHRRMIGNELDRRPTKPIRMAFIALSLFCAAGCAISATDATIPKACQSAQGVSCRDSPDHAGSGQGSGGGMNHGMS
jgi:hypothetical protein